MKSRTRVSLLLALLFLILLTWSPALAAAPRTDPPPTPEPAAWIVTLISIIVVPGIVQAIKLYQARSGKKLTRAAVTWIALAASLVITLLSTPWTLPTTTDPMQLVTSVLTLLGMVMGASTAVYNLLLAKLFESLSLDTETVLSVARLTEPEDAQL